MSRWAAIICSRMRKHRVFTGILASQSALLKYFTGVKHEDLEPTPSRGPEFVQSRILRTYFGARRGGVHGNSGPRNALFTYFIDTAPMSTQTHEGPNQRAKPVLPDNNPSRTPGNSCRFCTTD